MKKYFHSISPKEAIKELESSPYGLFENEAKERLKSYGKNVIIKDSENILVTFLKQFSKPFVLITLLLIAIFLYFNKIPEAILSGLIGLAYGLFNFFFEVKLNRSFERLRNITSLKITVIRDGKKREIPIEDVTIGDIVVLEKGDFVPADMRLIETNNLVIDERIVTGEDVPVQKEARAILDENTPIEDLKNLAFAGSYVYSGSGKGVVFAIGHNTHFYKYFLKNKKLLEKDRVKSALVKFGIFWTFVVIFILAGSLAFAYHHLGRDIKSKEFLKAFSDYSIEVVTSALLDGLILASLLSLLAGLLSLVKRQIFVKNYLSGEKLSAVKYLILDKRGVFTEEKFEVADYKATNSYLLMLTAGLCNNATDREGNNLDLSLIHWLNSKKFNWKLARNKYKREKFLKDDTLGVEVSIHKLGDKYFAFAKGSLDGIWLLSKNKSEEIIKWQEELNKKGLSVVAFGFAELDKIPKSVREIRLNFVGVVGLKDNLKEEVADLIKQLRSKGYKVILFTEEELEASLSFAKQHGIYQEGDLSLTGARVRDYIEDELMKVLERCSVIAEATPRDKLKVVKTLKWAKQNVLTSGREIEDILSLKIADVGVVGSNSYEALKEAADIIFDDLRLSKIVELLKVGQTIRKKVKNTVSFIVSSAIGEALLIASIILLKLPLPLTLSQMLWVKFFGSIIPSRAIGLGSFKGEYLEKPKKRFIFSIPHILDILTSAAVIIGLNLVLFLYLYKLYNLKYAMSGLFLSLLLTNIIMALQYSTPRPFFKNPLKFVTSNIYIYPLILIQVLSIGVAFYVMANILNIKLLYYDDLIYVAAPSILLFFVIELYKWIDLISAKRGK
jgi:Ca2+-transporting ATPase